MQKLDNNASKMIAIFGVAVLIIFFTGAYYFSNPVQFIIEGTKFSDPKEFVNRYPLEKEGLTENSIIVTIHGDRALEYGAIPFEIGDRGVITEEQIGLLSKVIDDGYESFTFKEAFRESEKRVISELEKNENFILKDHSETFCKIEINNEPEIRQSDEVCTELKTIL